jgi:hypothetical protein
MSKKLLLLFWLILISWVNAQSNINDPKTEFRLSLLVPKAQIEIPMDHKTSLIASGKVIPIPSIFITQLELKARVRTTVDKRIRLGKSVDGYKGGYVAPYLSISTGNFEEPVLLAGVMYGTHGRLGKKGFYDIGYGPAILRDINSGFTFPVPMGSLSIGFIIDF